MTGFRVHVQGGTAGIQCSWAVSPTALQRIASQLTHQSCLGPVNRSDVEGLKTLIVWDDEGKWRAVYMRQSLKLNQGADVFCQRPIASVKRNSTNCGE